MLKLLVIWLIAQALFVGAAAVAALALAFWLIRRRRKKRKAYGHQRDHD